FFAGGHDRDEALNIAVNELLSGRYPYYPVTYVPGLPHELGLDGNPLSPMPGELLFALPFTWAGDGSWQTFYWLLVLAIMLVHQLKPGVALIAFWSLLLCSPAVLNEVVSGGDLLPISIWLLVFTLALTNAVSSHHWLWIILLGIGLSSRINFLLILPLITGELARLYGFRRGLQYGLWVAIVCVVTVLPFYLYDPSGFSPLHIESILMRFEPVLPNVKFILPIVSGVLALLLGSLQIRYGSQRTLLWGCALVLAIPVLAVVGFSSIQVGYPEFSYAWYGIGAMIFAWAAAWMPSSNTMPS
ncbi:hypothetical protein QUF50_08225, partial [Thiotrichales bacterium HSG1]|nr:hypothetical protein [Thiotrichales bacterium HSG1]